MTQPDLPLPGDSALETLRAHLRRLHEENGLSSYREIARRAEHRITHTTVRDVIKGIRRTSWRSMRYVVIALHGDVEEVRRLWLAAHAASTPSDPTLGAAAAVLSGPALQISAGDLSTSTLRASAGELSAISHRTDVADIAPERLYDRERELAELAAFCAGDPPYTDQPYLWWQAGPWAGKTALLSWFALHPPAGVDVVSFFVTSRFAGQSDSNAFIDALIRQLASLAGEPPKAPLEAGARRRHLSHLLRGAARQCAIADRRLLLIVDGLDEDTGKLIAADHPSIAALLPLRCPPALRVLVASRPDPELPDDVPGSHPLRRIAPRRLTASLHAHRLEVAAKYELDRLLRGPAVQREVLGLLTACGGGLTLTDLEQLTGRPRARSVARRRVRTQHQQPPWARRRGHRRPRQGAAWAGGLLVRPRNPASDGRTAVRRRPRRPPRADTHLGRLLPG
ncbi:hypothetical protein Acor_82710 [Acrocarpospora corrugata]|uniref:Nephrocystin 3-like N-terminal domain-containing protein n=1 Tax=Acrocarpospora corrugata TaxID=35763 RepID=A0A5M3WDQ1_9ACTN|nr:NACHT domain-containing protein [Acrocarpospora corrugata]GES06202.1 hypothetical protein Acor_82710 [Acrocarpospora corrugata]